MWLTANAVRQVLGHGSTVVFLCLIGIGCAAHSRAVLVGPAPPSPTGTRLPWDTSGLPPQPGVTSGSALPRGWVRAVNPALRFVVVEFPFWRLPALDTRMGLYRDGRRVGQVKITGPVKENTIAADITNGDARPGDEVRAE